MQNSETVLSIWPFSLMLGSPPWPLGTHGAAPGSPGVTQAARTFFLTALPESVPTREAMVTGPLSQEGLTGGMVRPAQPWDLPQLGQVITKPVALIKIGKNFS